MNRDRPSAPHQPGKTGEDRDPKSGSIATSHVFEVPGRTVARRDTTKCGGTCTVQLATRLAGGDVLAAYRSAIAHSDEIISARRLGDPPERPETWWHDAGLELPDLRTIVVHDLVETSVHAGHAGRRS